MKTKSAAASAAMAMVCACTTESAGGGIQTSASAMPSGVPQMSGSIRVLEVMGPAEGRVVTPDWASIDAQPLGSKGNPVRAVRPEGQHAYRRRLICRDGSLPLVRRKGNVGAGVYGSIVDAYDVRCKTADYTIYLDMYHPNYIERRPVADFEILPPGRAS